MVGAGLKGDLEEGFSLFSVEFMGESAACGGPLPRFVCEHRALKKVLLIERAGQRVMAASAFDNPAQKEVSKMVPLAAKRTTR